MKLHFHNRFVLGLAWRLVLLVGLVFLFVAALGRADLGAARIVAGLVVLGAAFMLWRYIQRTNLELARFIDAVRFGDFSQGFSNRGQGSGFGDLSEVLDEAIKKLRDERHKLIDANRFYEAVLDDAPTALLTVDDGKVELANKAARRLLVRHSGVRVEDFAEYGEAFASALRGGAVGPAPPRPPGLATACRRPCWSAPRSSTGSAASSASSRCSRSRAS